jgi:HSP20 family molecular chaperone IbpA
MYVVLGAIILFTLVVFEALGQKLGGTRTQNSPQDQIRRHLELREEMHRRMREKILNGIGEDDDLFKGMEDMMNQAFSDPTMGAGLGLLDESSQPVIMDWTENKTGRTLIITPKDPSQKIDLDVKQEMITIKGENKSEHSASQFSNSFPVPHDCDGKKVKISGKDGKIMMEFPFRKLEKQSDGRRPLPPSGEEISI